MDSRHIINFEARNSLMLRVYLEHGPGHGSTTHNSSVSHPLPLSPSLSLPPLPPPLSPPLISLSLCLSQGLLSSPPCSHQRP